MNDVIQFAIWTVVIVAVGHLVRNRRSVSGLGSLCLLRLGCLFFDSPRLSWQALVLISWGFALASSGLTFFSTGQVLKSR